MIELIKKIWALSRVNPKYIPLLIGGYKIEFRIDDVPFHDQFLEEDDGKIDGIWMEGMMDGDYLEDYFTVTESQFRSLRKAGLIHGSQEEYNHFTPETARIWL